jgi:hypothetical protein
MFILEQTFTSPAIGPSSSLVPRLVSLDVQRGQITIYRSEVLHKIAQDSWYKEWKVSRTIRGEPIDLINIDDEGFLTIHELFSNSYRRAQSQYSFNVLQLVIISNGINVSLSLFRI